MPKRSPEFYRPPHDSNEARSGLNKSTPESKEIESRLFLAEMDTHCPMLDFHGMTTDVVPLEIDNFLAQNQDEDHVRIMCGLGTGAIAKAVLNHLKRLEKENNDFVEAFKFGQSGASCVVLLKK